MKEKIVLAYSGGLDTSIIIHWLKENYDCEVIALCGNVGQNEDMDKIVEKALLSGASKAFAEDLTKEFIEDYVFKGLKAGAVYENKYLLGTSYARPLLAKALVELAHKEGAKSICHGCTGKGNDQVRFETSIWAFDPSINIISPWRIWDITSREDAIDYAVKNNIPITASKEKIYSEDENLWHISHEGGEIEQIGVPHSDDIYKLTVSPENAPDTPTYVEINFEKGIPVGINGKNLSGVEIVKMLNKIGGANGIGIEDMVENRLVGMKSRGIYETPGGSILYKAHAELEEITLDKETHHFKELVSNKYAELVYNGQWFSKLKFALDEFVDKTQENVTGKVVMKLYKGNCTISYKESPYALYDEQISSFGKSELYNHKDSEGFIKLFSLPIKITSMKVGM